MTLPVRLITVFTCLVCILSSLNALAKTKYITVTLPEEVVHQSVRDALPLSIKPNSSHLEGTLVIDSISRLEMNEDMVFLQGQILGRNLILSTRIGDQDLRVRVGEFRYPLTCNLSVRYDEKQRILYLTPHLVRPEKTLEGENARTILPVLAMLDNREYPVSLEDVQGFSTEIGEQKYSIDMEPVGIKVADSRVVVRMVPIVNKSN